MKERNKGVWCPALWPLLAVCSWTGFAREQAQVESPAAAWI